MKRPLLKLLVFLTILVMYYVGNMYTLSDMWFAFWDGRLSVPASVIFWPLWLLVTFPVMAVFTVVHDLGVAGLFGDATDLIRYVMFFASPAIAAVLVHFGIVSPLLDRKKTAG